ncbi:MAG: hypothetical protein JNJ45_09090 [Chthonomonas sp.]|nr:hypothetical protein [Chthonomonas sp.]
MIYAKHVVYLGLVLAIAPWLGRALVNLYLERFRLSPVPATWVLLVGSITVGFGLPLLGQGVFDLLSTQTTLQSLVARMIALGVVGLLFGVLIGLQPYMHFWRAMLLGVIAGVGCAWLYSVLPAEWWSLVIYATVLAGLPLLSFEAPNKSGQIRVRASRRNSPMRGLWH